MAWIPSVGSPAPQHLPHPRPSFPGIPEVPKGRPLWQEVSSGGLTVGHWAWAPVGSRWLDWAATSQPLALKAQVRPFLAAPAAPPPPRGNLHRPQNSHGLGGCLLPAPCDSGPPALTRGFCFPPAGEKGEVGVRGPSGRSGKEGPQGPEGAGGAARRHVPARLRGLLGGPARGPAQCGRPPGHALRSW